MTKYLCFVICVIATVPGVTAHPPASETQRTCFNSFDNFDECWEKIEELCLNEATGDFEECYEEDTENDHGHAEEVPEYVQQFPHSQHCYARFSPCFP